MTAIDYRKLTDATTKYPLLAIRIGGQPLTTAPPTYVQEITIHVAVASFRTRIEISVFDETWFKLVDILGLNLGERRQTIVEVDFGWNYEGGYVSGLIGEIDTIKMDLAPEGISFNLMGYVKPSTLDVESDTEDKWVFKNMTRSQVAEAIVRDKYKMSEDQYIIEPTDDEPKDWTVNGGFRNSIQFLFLLAQKAAPLDPIEITTKQNSKIMLAYRSLFDIQGIYHFHSAAYTYDDNKNKSIEIAYPLGGGNTPALEFVIADVNFISPKMEGNKMDRLTGRHIELVIEENETEDESYIPVELSSFGFDPASTYLLVRLAVKGKTGDGTAELVVNGSRVWIEEVRSGPVKNGALPPGEYEAARYFSASRTVNYTGSRSYARGNLKIAFCDRPVQPGRCWLIPIEAVDVPGLGRRNRFALHPDGGATRGTMGCIGFQKGRGGNTEQIRKDLLSAIGSGTLPVFVVYTSDTNPPAKSYKPRETDKKKKVNISSTAMSPDEFARFAQSSRRKMMTRAMRAETTLMGQPFIEFGDPLNLTLNPPNVADKSRIEYLEGLWEIEQITHTINMEGFVTRVAAFKNWDEEDDSTYKAVDGAEAGI